MHHFIFRDSFLWADPGGPGGESGAGGPHDNMAPDDQHLDSNTPSKIQPQEKDQCGKDQKSFFNFCLGIFNIIVSNI